MPTEKAPAHARKDKREGKSASSQAGQIVREELERIRESERNARSAVGIKSATGRKTAKKAAGTRATSRAAGATRAARTRAMRARTR